MPSSAPSAISRLVADASSRLASAESPEDVEATIADAEARLREAGADDAARAQLEAVKALALELSRARGELQAALRARDALLAGLAHDLRNPLNTFAMSVGLLRDDFESENVEPTRGLALIGRMERASQRMQGLIEDLFEASRMDPETLSLTKSNETTSALIRDAAAVMKRDADARGVTIGAAIGDDLRVEVDRVRIHQALAKLLSYAIRAVGEGGKIELSVTRTDGGAAFKLRPLLAGGTEANLALDETRGGLALLIVRAILAAHGSTVSGDGHALTFKLPTSS